MLETAADATPLAGDLQLELGRRAARRRAARADLVLESIIPES